MAKKKNIANAIRIEQVYNLSDDMWCQCCCLVAPYAEHLDMSNFCALQMTNKTLDDMCDGIVLMAMSGQVIKGFLFGGMDLIAGRAYASVDWFFLDGSYQRCGIGRQMLQKFEGVVRNKYHVFGVDLKPLDTARKFYQKNGYTDNPNNAGYMSKFFDGTGRNI